MPSSVLLLLYLLLSIVLGILTPQEVTGKFTKCLPARLKIKQTIFHNNFCYVTTRRPALVMVSHDRLHFLNIYKHKSTFIRESGANSLQVGPLTSPARAFQHQDPGQLAGCWTAVRVTPRLDIYVPVCTPKACNVCCTCTHRKPAWNMILGPPV